MQNTRKARSVLILWNQPEDDVYEQLRERGATPLPWDPSRQAAEVRTVQEEMIDLVESVRMCGHRVACINVVDDMQLLLASLRLHQPDVVLNLIEYFNDDENLEASVVGLYELLGVPYTGSNGYTLSLCQRKHHTKHILEGAGLATAPHFVVDSLDAPMPDPEHLADRFPFIVKPALEDASGGIENEAVVRDVDQLEARVRYVLQDFDQPALVEQYIDGREIHVAILGNEEPEILPLFEMRFCDDDADPSEQWRPRIISYSGKWDPLSRDFYTLDPICPATDIDDEVAERLADIALRAYRVTGCRDYARIDMRLSEDGTPYILEVNPNPDLTDGSAFIMCAQASGRSYAQTLDEILALAIDRNPVVKKTGADGDQIPTDHLSRKYWLQERAERPVETDGDLSPAPTERR